MDTKKPLVVRDNRGQPFKFEPAGNELLTLGDDSWESTMDELIRLTASKWRD